LQWAGANNSCLLVQHGELIEIKPDKMPIAIYDKMDDFTLHEVKLFKGDIIYLVSDGFADQFGGPNHKKFMSKRLKELLLQISVKPFSEQRNILNNTVVDWMTGYDRHFRQTDDITILGLKI